MPDRLEKTEKATPKRREEARRKGQIAKSKEVASIVIIMTGLVMFYFFGTGMVISIKEMMRELIVSSGSLELGQDGVYLLYRKVLVDLSYIMLPLLLFPVAGVLANLMQVGLLFTTEPLTPNLAKLNPVEGVKKIFSPTSLMELVKGVVKLVVVAYMAYIAMKREMDGLLLLPEMDVVAILTYLGSAAFNIILMTSWVLLLLAAIDYIFQKWEFEKGLMMTKQEVKDEHKDTEGNPMIKSRIRTLQRQVARQRMMKEVPEATAVITNPNHLAIAVKYEQGKMRAPVVVAKGANLVAEKIKEVARKNGVPMVENKPLARTLWKTVEIGKEIPASLYKALAEVLAYVYRIKSREVQGGHRDG